MLIIKPTNIKIKELQKINLYNWQYLQHEENNIIIIVSYRKFIIHDLDLTTFNELNNSYEKIILEKEIDYLQNVLVCKKCVFGSLDWLEAVRGIKNIEDRQLRIFHQRKDLYKRDQNYITKFVNYKNNQYCYLSSAKIRKGFERCKYCYGSGILFEDLNILGNLVKVSP